MSTPSPAIIEQRLADNVYDSIGNQIADMESAALANAQYKDHYNRHLESWSGNYIYKDTKGDDFRTIIVGEVRGPEMGTILCAKGNHFPGTKKTPFRPVTDASRVKDVLVLGLPTEATFLLKNVFANQLAELNTVLDYDDKADEEQGKDRPSKEWVKCADGTGDGVYEKNLIVVHMLPKYGRPATTSRAGGAPARCVTKRSLSTIELDDSETSPPPPPPDNSITIREGAFYDPYLNTDYGGPYFQHVRNKLVQLDVRDQENNLVAPWCFPEALRPGTVVLLNCSLHCFVIKEKSGDKRIYQINAHSVRILASSDVHVPEPVRPMVPNNEGDTGPADKKLIAKGSAAMKAANAFNAFSTKSCVTSLASPPTVRNDSPVASGSGSPLIRLPALSTAPVPTASTSAADTGSGEKRAKKSKKAANSKVSTSMEVLEMCISQMNCKSDLGKIESKFSLIEQERNKRVVIGDAIHGEELWQSMRCFLERNTDILGAVVAWFTNSIPSGRGVGVDGVHDFGVHVSLKFALDQVSVVKVRPVTRRWIARTYYGLSEKWAAPTSGIMALTCWWPGRAVALNWVHAFPDVVHRELEWIEATTERARFMVLAQFLYDHTE